MKETIISRDLLLPGTATSNNVVENQLETTSWYYFRTTMAFLSEFDTTKVAQYSTYMGTGLRMLGCLPKISSGTLTTWDSVRLLCLDWRRQRPYWIQRPFATSFSFMTAVGFPSFPPFRRQVFEGHFRIVIDVNQSHPIRRDRSKRDVGRHDGHHHPARRHVAVPAFQ